MSFLVDELLGLDLDSALDGDLPSQLQASWVATNNPCPPVVLPKLEGEARLKQCAEYRAKLIYDDTRKKRG